MPHPPTSPTSPLLIHGGHHGGFPPGLLISPLPTQQPLTFSPVGRYTLGASVQITSLVLGVSSLPLLAGEWSVQTESLLTSGGRALRRGRDLKEEQEGQHKEQSEALRRRQTVILNQTTALNVKVKAVAAASLEEA